MSILDQTTLGEIGPVRRLLAEKRVKRAFAEADRTGDIWQRDPYCPLSLAAFRAATDELDNALACAEEFGCYPGVLERAA